LLYFLFLCFDHEQITFESVSFSRLSTRFTCVRTLKTDMYTGQYGHMYNTCLNHTITKYDEVIVSI